MIDTWWGGGINIITDLSTGDVVQLSGGTVIANNVSAFVADSHTSARANAVFTLNSSTSGSTIDMSLINTNATGGFTIVGASGVDILTGSSNADVLTGGAGSNTLTGGAGNDTFNISADSTNTITDLSTGDILTVAATGNVTANNVSAFVATAATVNNASSNSAVTLNAAATGSTIDLSQATGTTGFTVVGSTGSDLITGSSKADVLTGGGGSDTFVFTTPANSSVTNFDTITDFTSGVGQIKTGAAGGVTSLNQGGSYTASGTGALATDIAAAVSAGNAAGATHSAAANDAYLVTITGTGAGNYVFQDTNGDGIVGAKELVIQLTGTTTLTAADFIA